MLNYLTTLFIGIISGASLAAWSFSKKKHATTFVYPHEAFFGNSTVLIDEPNTKENYKLVTIVRKDLKMTKGKWISQCCHAVVKAVDRTMRKFPDVYEKYKQSGRFKAIVKVEERDELMRLASHALSLGLLVTPIKDAGRTQIAPGELTVVGIGPGPSALVDKVVNNLLPY